VAAMLLVNRAGQILLRQRTHTAPRRTAVWDVPTAHGAAGETAEQTAVRALWDQTRLRPDEPITLFEHANVPADDLAVDYFAAGTVAVQDDIIADGAETLFFVPASQIFGGRQFTDDAAGVLDRFKNSLAYSKL
jgi:ADP-ribose pyrophosphatase YjhB (NUDIX family)